MQTQHRFNRRIILYGVVSVACGYGLLFWITTVNWLPLEQGFLNQGRSLWQGWLIMPLLVLLVPIGLAAYLRQPILSATGDRLNQDGNRYLHRLNQLTVSIWFSWLGLSLMPESSFWLNQALGAERHLWRELSEVTLLTGPPVLTITLCHRLAYPVFSRLGSVWTSEEVIKQTFWGQLRNFLPLVLLFSGGRLWWMQQVALAVVFLGLACLSQLWLTHSVMQAHDLRLQAITTGRLRDRIFALAERAGVQLNQIYMLPVSRQQWPNAFAGQNQQIILTETLLNSLSQREVDAIVAHELAHLQAHHPRLLQTLLAGIVLLSLGCCWFLSNWLPSGLIMVGCLLLGLLLYSQVAHRCEYQADRQAIQLTADPTALISSLTKLAQFDRSNSSSCFCRFASHPSMQQRIAAIVNRHQLKPTGLRLIESDFWPPGYQLPTALQTPLVFSSAFKQQLSLHLIGIQTASVTVTPALVSLLMHYQTWHPLIEWGGVIGSGLVSIMLSLWLTPRFVQWRCRHLAQQLNAKLQQQGVTPIAWGGMAVGFAPEVTDCRYEGLPFWDLGFLVLTGDRLCYIGEQVQFGIRRDRISRMTLHPYSHSGLPLLAIEWQDSQGIRRRFQLHGQDRKVIPLIRQWQQANCKFTNPDLLSHLAPPNPSVVTHQPWNRMAQLKQSIQTQLILLPVAFGMGIGLDLPWNVQPGSGFCLLLIGLWLPIAQMIWFKR